MPESEISAGTTEVEELKLAAWLRLNGQELVERKLKPDGNLSYVFKDTAQIADLVETWLMKSADEARLARYSSIVSFEIRKAIELRRRNGLPLRLNRELQNGAVAADTPITHDEVSGPR